MISYHLISCDVTVPNEAGVTECFVPVDGSYTTMSPLLLQVMVGAEARQSASQICASGTTLLHWQVPVLLLKVPPLVPHTVVQ